MEETENEIQETFNQIDNFFAKIRSLNMISSQDKIQIQKLITEADYHIN